MASKQSLIGREFGILTVKAEAEFSTDSKGRKIRRWLCVCKEGNECIVLQTNLLNGGTKSCGCTRSDPRKQSLAGREFGSLIVKSESEPLRDSKGRKIRRWLCICKEGHEVIVYQSNLLNGTTKSCGCMRAESWMPRKTRKPGVDLIGKIFGKLVVKSEIEPVISDSGRKDRRFILECTCRERREVIATFGNLQNGTTRSCGCIRTERLSHQIGDELGFLKIIDIRVQNAKSFLLVKCICDRMPTWITTQEIATSDGCMTEIIAAHNRHKGSIARWKHGLSHSKGYKSWSKIPKKDLCSEWLDVLAYDAWYSAQLLNCPDGKLERMDKAKPYGPDNCRLRDRVAESIQVSKINQLRQPVDMARLF